MLIMIRQVPLCQSLEVYLLPSIRDKLTALEAALACRFIIIVIVIVTITITINIHFSLPPSSMELAPVLGRADASGVTAKDQVADNHCENDHQIIIR